MDVSSSILLSQSVKSVAIVDMGELFLSVSRFCFRRVGVRPCPMIVLLAVLLLQLLLLLLLLSFRTDQYSLARCCNSDVD